MKAFVYEFRDGQAKCGTGRVTPNYKNLANMKRYFIQNLPAGCYQILAFFDWDNRYKDADITEVVTVYGYPPEVTRISVHKGKLLLGNGWMIP